MNKVKQIADILGITEAQVTELALDYLFYLVSMKSNEAHNQWLKDKFCGTNNIV